MVIYHSLPTDAESFERWVGIEVTSDVEILAFDLDRGPDFMSLNTCFKSSPSTRDQLLQKLALRESKITPPPNTCVDSNATLHLAVPNLEQESVHGFSSWEQSLAHDPNTGRVFYVFEGVN